MQPRPKPDFTVVSEPLKGEDAQASQLALRELLDKMTVSAREAGLTEQKLIELLRNVG